jgi:alpha-mannosidase
VTLIGLDGCTYWYKAPQYFGHLLLRCVELKPGTWEAFCPASLTGSGAHTFSYAIQFPDGDWRQADPQRRSLELRHPPAVLRADYPSEARLPAISHSFLSLEGPALLSAWYRAEDGIYVRFYEHQGKGGEVKITLDGSPVSAQAVDLLGGPVDIPVALHGEELSVTVRPWQIVTLKYRQ